MDFPLPPMGEGLYEVELVRWLVKPGEAVARGQGLMEVMSDKATMEVPSPFAGTVTATTAEPGAKLKVGEVVLSYEGGSDPSPQPPPRGGEGASPEPKTETAAPSSSPSPPRGGGRGEGLSASPVPATSAPKTNGTAVAHPVVAAPSVRHLARKLNIDLGRVRGSGPAGRILLDDLAPYLKPKAADAPGKSGTDVSRLDFGTAGRTVKLAGLRRKIAEKMARSKRLIPHYSYIDECDLSDLVKLRGQLREPFAKAGVKLTYLAFFVKAVTKALKEVPVVNSTYDEEKEEVTHHAHYNVGLAVAAPTGLIVPVIKDADQRDLAGLATEIERLSDDAKAGRPRMDDLRGGTFTVTSVGGIGGLISTPIVNHPEVGIMGIGKVQTRPVYDSRGELRPAEMVYLSFSFDHRIVDGAVGASFGNAVLKHLQNPAALLLPDRLR